MKPSAPLALALLAATAFAHLEAQSPIPFNDPANLRGERPAPLTGRELPIDKGALGLQQLLRKLNTRASIMNIVAHPDDEDGGMMALYSRGLGARVADLSLTRGEGGQNAVTGDFEDALGLLRTQELLSCDRYSGVDQFFGTEVDFGFSKTKEEAFAKWTHERVLYDVVRAIRLYRPLVLTSTWVGGVTDGHGQHQVSGEIAQEAFVAAGDPKVFPELTAEGILPWQPLRVYARVPMQSISEKGLYDYATGQYTPAKFTNYVTGEVTTTPPTTDVIVHEGTQDPLLTHAAANPSDIRSKAALDPDTPFTYVQFARIGLGLQKSQVGPGVRNAPAGAFDASYHLYGTALCQAHAPSLKNCHPERSEGSAVPSGAASSSKDDPTFFTGIDTSIMSLQQYHTFPTALVPKLAGDIQDAIEKFDPGHPETIASTLADALKITEDLIRFTEKSDATDTEKANALHELSIKRVQLNNALVLALGIKVDAPVPDSIAPKGQEFAGVKAEYTAPLQAACTLQRAFLQDAQGNKGRFFDVKDDALLSEKPTIRSIIPPNTIVGGPYFRRASIEGPVYDLTIPALRNAPQQPPALTAWGYVKCGTSELEIGRVVHAGNQPLQFVPPISVSLPNNAQVLTSNQNSISLNVIVAPSDAKITEEKLTAPATWKVTPAATAATCAGCHPFRIEVPIAGRVSSPLHASVNFDGITYSQGYRSIGYGDLPRTNYFTPAVTRIVPVDLKLPAHHNIAYLPGTGDDVPQALASIGLTPTTLTVTDLTPEHLKQFDTVILGVRTYNAHPDLHGIPTKALLDYARNGGNVVVQYQTTEFTGDDAPYPLSLGSNEKVVDEAAPVHLLSTNAPQLTTPNTITSADFNGWIEERGHGFLSTWDPHYTPLTETHDPGQDPQKGGLITAPLGKGHWTYCAYALYRQLPEAVPGAYRLFLNLLNP